MTGFARMRSNAAVGLLICLVSAGCQPPSTGETAPADLPAPTPSASTATQIATNPLKQAYFGDLHVHTSWSTDAYNGGNRVGPEAAYRFARGEPVQLPNGIVTQLAVPLDFTAITDHAEGFDAVAACTDETHSEYESDTCRNMRAPPANADDYFETVFARAAMRPAPRNPALCRDKPDGGNVCLDYARVTWQRTQQVAEQFNEPGKFTALIGYEFSALLTDFGMLHRNVIFRGSDVIAHAVSSSDVRNQADLFRQLDAGCVAPCEVLTIPHNTNYSWGLTFSRTDEDGSRYTDEDLARRARIERLVEVTQQKGESECQIGVGTTDEDCGFEKMFPICEEGDTRRCAVETSFVRNALLDGILYTSEGKVNPFKLGMIGSTDTHGSDPGNTEPRNRYAQASGNQAAVEGVFRAAHPVVGAMRQTDTGGLAGVWAESNTRSDIFDALRNREAFATSGTRLTVRFFGGDLPDDIDVRSDAVEAAYRNGVPMGGDLDGTSIPRFWVWAAQDPNGVSLDRIQVVKGWVANGEQKHNVRDVVCSGGRNPGADGRCPVTESGVDTASCNTNDRSGAAELQTSFVDAEFDPGQNAFYYVRVFENPSCRWTTWLANSAGVDLPSDVPATIQNRAWTSPIWVTPAR